MGRGGRAPRQTGATLDVGLRTRSRTYGRLTAVVVGLLAAGLVVPFVVGHPPTPPIISASARDLGGPPGSAEPATDATGSQTASTEVPTGSSAASASRVSPATAAGRGGAGSTAAAHASNTASDVGVTPTSVRFAYLIPDTSSAASAGFTLNIGDQADMMRTFIEPINAAGGVFGRQLDPVFLTYNALDTNDQSAKCVQANEESHVFAGVVVTSYAQDAITCFTHTYHRAFLKLFGDGVGIYKQSEGRFMSAGMNWSRVGANAAWEFYRAGLLKDAKTGKQLKVGAVGNVIQEGVDTFESTLKGVGIDVVDGRVSGSVAQVQAQLPLIVNQMKTAGVEVVFVTLSLVNATLFVQEAERQQWFPEYRVSDLSVLTQDGAVAQMPSSFDNAIGMTSTRSGELAAGIPETADAASCRVAYEKHAGRSIDRSSTEYASLLSACASLHLFVGGLERAGANLTAATFSSGLRGWTSFQMPGMFPASFGSQKLDGDDSSRLVVWHADCKCWHAVGQPVRDRY